jgi:exodeoxyribonuclease VII large subunit
MLHRQLMLYAPALLRNEQKRIELNDSKLRSASPDRILRLGFSITRLDGKAVRDVTQLREGDEIETSLASGTLKSIVKWTRK